jgi:hypothetical protein
MQLLLVRSKIVYNLPLEISISTKTIQLLGTDNMEATYPAKRAENCMHIMKDYNEPKPLILCAFQLASPGITSNAPYNIKGLSSIERNAKII